jgi:translocator protein
MRSSVSIKPSYLIIPILVILVAVAGSQFTATGLQMEWYTTLIKPELQPPAWLFGPVWTLLYILIASSAVIFWNKAEHGKKFTTVTLLFLANGFLNAYWTYLFFVKNILTTSLTEIILLNLTTLALILFIWPHQITRRFLYFFHRKVTEKNPRQLKIASLLLLPYLLWGLFATYLNYMIWLLN